MLPLDEFLRNLVSEYFSMPKKIQIPFKSGSISRTLHEDQYTFFIIPRSILLRVRNVSGRNYRVQCTHFMSTIFFFCEPCRV